MFHRGITCPSCYLMLQHTSYNKPEWQPRMKIPIHAGDFLLFVFRPIFSQNASLTKRWMHFLRRCAIMWWAIHLFRWTRGFFGLSHVWYSDLQQTALESVTQVAFCSRYFCSSTSKATDTLIFEIIVAFENRLATIFADNQILVAFEKRKGNWSNDYGRLCCLLS